MQRVLIRIAALAAVVFSSYRPCDAQSGSLASGDWLPSGRAFAPALITVAVTTNRSGREDYYMMGEPVFVTIHLTNNAPNIATVRFRPVLDADVRFQVQNPRSLPKPIHDPYPNPVPSSMPMEIMPFETRSFPIHLLQCDEEKKFLRQWINGVPEFISWPLLVFDAPGDYRIFVEVDLEVNTTNHPTLKPSLPAFIHFKPAPKKSSEEAILEALHKDRERMKAYHRLVAGPGQVEFFEEALVRYPKNRFAPYFAYLLARTYARGDAEDKNLAVNMYRLIMKDYPYFTMIQGVMTECAELMDKQGYSDEAHSLLKLLIHENPDFMRLGQQSPLMQKFVNPGGSQFEFKPEYWMLTPP